MIDTIKMTPAEYSKQSRDYQVLARLYTAVYNLSKMYIDSMSVWNKDISNELVQLRAYTLNFHNRHDWEANNLEALTSCFKYLVSKKGTLEALNTVICILSRVNKVEYKNHNFVQEGNNVILYLSKGLLSLGIIEDIVKYILPAGFTYRIIEYTSTDTEAESKLTTTHSVKRYHSSEGAGFDDYEFTIKKGHNSGGVERINTGKTIQKNIVVKKKK